MNDEPDIMPTGQSRSRLAAQLRKCQPDRLVGWAGIMVGGAFVNPYARYGDARYAKEPRETLICELLVGDVVVDTLLHPGCRAFRRVKCDNPRCVDGKIPGQRQSPNGPLARDGRRKKDCSNCGGRGWLELRESARVPACVLDVRCYCVAKPDFTTRRDRCGNWRTPPAPSTAA